MEDIYLCEGCGDELEVCRPGINEPGMVIPCQNCMEEVQVDEIILEGGNGGEFLKIKKVRKDEKYNDTIYLESGHCTIYDIRREVPLELLTLIINNALMHKTPEEIIEECDWNDDFKKILLKKLKKT